MKTDVADALPATSVGNATFVIYCVYVIDFYVRISSRVPGLGALRPTLLLFAVLLVMLVVQARHLRDRLTTPASKALAALLIYVVVSIPMASWPGSVVRNVEPYVRTLAFFYFTVLIVDSPKRFYIYLAVLVGSQVFRVLEPLYLNITAGYLGDKTYLGAGEFAGRLAGAPRDVVNPNGLGFVAVTCIPYLYYCLFLNRKIWQKAAAAVLIAASLYVLVLTLSRGAMIALMVIIWIIFRQSQSKFLFMSVMAIALVIGWAHLDDVHKDRYLSLVSHNTRQSYSAEGRAQVTEEEFTIGMERPIFGHGLGTTAESKVHAGHGPQASHNLYTEILIEVGLVGGFLFLRFLYAIHKEVKLAAQRVAEQVDNPDQDMQRRLITCFVAVFWMYVVFSANYWGLTQDYWYAFAGVVTAFGRQIVGATASASAAVEAPTPPSAVSRRPRSVLDRPRSSRSAPAATDGIEVKRT